MSNRGGYSSLSLLPVENLQQFICKRLGYDPEQSSESKEAAVYRTWANTWTLWKWFKMCTVLWYFKRLWAISEIEILKTTSKTIRETEAQTFVQDY